LKAPIFSSESGARAAALTSRNVPWKILFTSVSCRKVHVCLVVARYRDIASLQLLCLGMTASLATCPSLHLVKQTALNEEKVTKNGQTQNVCVIVKNSPFQMIVALLNGGGANFNHLSFDIKLLYDMNEEKEVAYVQSKPVEYKPTLSDMADQISFDIKIKVLSSHHEDNFFRLKLTVWDPNNALFPPLTLMSLPIKVISKPLKHRKPRSKLLPYELELNHNDDSDEYVEGALGHSNRSKTSRKRTASEVDSLQDRLERIENLQVEQLNLLKQMAPVFNNSPMMNALTEEITSPSKKQKADNATNAPTIISSQQQQQMPVPEKDFESLFLKTLDAYSNLLAEEKLERMRKILRMLNSSSLEQLLEMVDLMNAVGLHQQATKSLYQQQQQQQNQFLNVSLGVSGVCLTDPCPHKLELQNLTQFYQEAFFDSGVSPLTNA
jgi:hypothetical protein